MVRSSIAGHLSLWPQLVPTSSLLISFILITSCLCKASSFATSQLAESSSLTSSETPERHPVVAPLAVRSRSLLHHVMPLHMRNKLIAERSGNAGSRPGPAARTSLEQLSPKRFFDFLTDPSLLITVLHSLEVAYWTFPFGFVLTPVINFFRVPNRRSLDVMSKSNLRSKRSNVDAWQLQRSHQRLLNSIEYANLLKAKS